MLVEHTFVTTIPMAQAMPTIEQFLRSRGFIIPEDAPPASEGSSQPALHLQRPIGRVGRNRWLAILPQILRLQFDRGRITLALSISPQTDWNRKARRPAFKRQITPGELNGQTNLLVAEAQAVESILAAQLPVDQAVQQWDRIEQQLVQEVQDAARRHRAICIVLGLITLAIIAAPIVALCLRGR